MEIQTDRPVETALPASSTTKLQKIRRHALWILVAFLLALSFYALRNLVEKADNLSNARQVRDWAHTSTAIGVLVHELQKERGMSSGFIASAGRQFKYALQEQRLLTDQARAAFLATRDSWHGNPGWIETPLANLQRLDALRLRIDHQAVSREYLADRYTAVIDTLLALQLADFGEGVESAVFRQQMAFAAFISAKEQAGQERGLLSGMLSDRNFSAGRMEMLSHIRAVEDTNITHFRHLAPPEALARYDGILKQPYLRATERIRVKVAAAGLREASLAYVEEFRQAPLVLPTAEEWFAVSSQRINAMKELEDALSATVSLRAHDLENHATREFVVNGLLAIMSLLLAGSFVLQIQRGRRVTAAKLNLADTFFSNSVESILVADANQVIVEVNPAFSRISGYAREEIIGLSPRILQSGRHDRAFYEAMWHQIMTQGSWEGEVWNRRKNGEIFPALLSIVAVKDRSGAITHYTGMVSDLSQHKEVEALLQQLRTFDALTGLPNRESWLSALDQAVANGRRGKSNFTVLELDLDRFKLVNDSLGHTAGDQLLVEAAERIKGALRKHDIVARPDGDRFSILLYDTFNLQDIGIVCEKLLAAFVPPFAIDSHTLHVTASMGVAIFPEDGADAGTLMMNAESALYSAKEDGRNTSAYYSREMNARGAQVLNLERMLRLALEEKQFSVLYQPQFNSRGGDLAGVEALLRWNSPELGFVPPAQFISIAEETGLIVSIGAWILRESCRQAKSWLDRYGYEIPVAVNLSARQFRRTDLLATVAEILDETGLPAHLLELEITEGLLMVDPLGAIDILRGLHCMGIRIALDDFGTGYSSLAYLKNFPIDRLKIDRAFVRDLPENASDRAIAHTVIALGLNLELEVLAEGVETAAQGRFLEAAGCQVFQGFLYGKPMTVETLLGKIESGEYHLPAERLHEPVV